MSGGTTFDASKCDPDTMDEGNADVVKGRYVKDDDDEARDAMNDGNADEEGGEPEIDFDEI